MILIMMMKKMGRMDSKGYEDVELHGWCIDFMASSMVHNVSHGVCDGNGIWYQWYLLISLSLRGENKKG